MRLGIDIGRVLISPDGEGTGGDTSFIGGSMAAALRTPPYEDMFEVVPTLVERFHGQVWLVSKCGLSVQEKSRQWLRHHRFFERCGIAPENLRFCRQRPQKADHCRELGLSHFIDDRSDVLGHLNGLVGQRYLFGPQKHDHVPAGLIHVANWRAALALVHPERA